MPADVNRMLECGDLSKGYREYSCMTYGEVDFVQNVTKNMSAKLIKVTHRHMVFTIPE